MSDLKPCDHCGEYDGVVIWKHERGFIVECGECGASSGVYPTEEKAAKAWNTRPAEDAKDKEIKRLKKQVADREDEGYAGFIIGVEQMKKRLVEKNKEIEQLKEDNQVYRDMLNSLLNEEVYHLDNATMTNIKYELDNRGKDTNVPTNAPDTGKMEG